jgi:hypothetical protein
MSRSQNNAATRAEESDDSVDAMDLVDSRWRNEVQIIGTNPSSVNEASSNAIICTPPVNNAQALELIAKMKARHLVQATSDVERSLNRAALMIAEPECFLTNPISSILDPLAASASREQELATLEIEFRTLDETEPIRRWIDQFLFKIKCPESLIPDIQMISKELVRNAVLNSPHQLDPEQSSPGINISEIKPSITGAVPARLVLGMEAQNLVIACIDPFGTLEPNKVFARLLRCQNDGVASNIRWAGSGAGIGNYIVFQGCRSYFLGVEHLWKTVVAAEISLLKSALKREQLAKCIHWLDF